MRMATFGSRLRVTIRTLGRALVSAWLAVVLLATACVGSVPLPTRTALPIPTPTPAAPLDGQAPSARLAGQRPRFERIARQVVDSL